MKRLNLSPPVRRKLKRKFRNSMIWGSVAGSQIMMLVSKAGADAGDLSSNVMLSVSGVYVLLFIIANCTPHSKAEKQSWIENYTYGSEGSEYVQL